jgi:hypothetical protein
MQQVLKAFRSLPGADITAGEFASFWKDCTPELKVLLVANAADMGFTA